MLTIVDLSEDRLLFGELVAVRTRSTMTRDRNLQFRGNSSSESVEFSPLDFFVAFSPGFLCNLVKASPQNVGKIAQSQEGTNVHLSNMHFVLCQIFGLNRLTPPFHAFFPLPSSLLLPH